MGAEQRAILSATREFRVPVRRQRGSGIRDTVGPGTRDVPLTNTLLRRQASIRDIGLVREEGATGVDDFTGGLDATKAEALWRDIELRREWVAVEEKKAVAALPKATTVQVAPDGPPLTRRNAA